MFAGGGSHVIDNDRGETLSRPLIWGGADGATNKEKIHIYNHFPYEQVDPKNVLLNPRPPNVELSF